MAHSRVRRLTVSATALLFWAHGLMAVESVQRLGTEFQVTTFTAGTQDLAAVAIESDGDFVVAWHSSQDGSALGIFARQFSSSGTALASEFQVNTYTSQSQSYPAVAFDGAGAFVVAWRSYGQDGSQGGIFARRFDSAANPLGIELQVNSFTLGVQASPVIARDDGGDFVIAWDSTGQDGDGYGVFARRFNASGSALATEFQVNTYTATHELDPAIAIRDDGDFVIAWRSTDQDGSGNGVFAQRFDASGALDGAEFQVNTNTQNGGLLATIAMRGAGDFVVAWRSDGQDGSGQGVFGQRFDSTGAPQAAEFQVNTYTEGSQMFPSAAMDGDGAFVVAWASTAQDGSSYGVFAQSFAADGTRLASEFQIATYTENTQTSAAVASAPDGRFVVAWSSNGQDGSAYGVFAQRFAKLAVLDVDGNGSVTPLTDGLLILRFLFGFSGATLTTGAIGPGCTRCDAGAIVPYLEGLD